MLTKLLDWLSQQSTQKAIIALLTALGLQFDVIQIEHAMTLFLTLYSLLAGLRDKS